MTRHRKCNLKFANGRITMDGPKMTFCIPKVKRSQEEGCRTLVSPYSRDYKEALQTIQNAFLDSSYCLQENWKASSVEQITNKKLQKSFQEKRQELRSKLNCYDVGERFAFSIVDSEEKVNDACQNGLFSGHEMLTSATLGKRSDGVHVWLYADVALRLTSIDCTTIHLIVYKIMRGRVKYINPGVEVEPTPNYECHVSRDAPNAKGQFDQIVNNAQIYIYEYDKECLLRRQPRHCYPYSVVTFTKPAPSSTGNEHILEATTTIKNKINSVILPNKYLPKNSNKNANRKSCKEISGRLQPIIVRSEQEDKLLKLKQKLLKNQKTVQSMKIKKKNAKIQGSHDTSRTNCHAKNVCKKEDRKLHTLSVNNVGLSRKKKEGHLLVDERCTKVAESNKTNTVSKETGKPLPIKKKMSVCETSLKENECLVNKSTGTIKKTTTCSTKKAGVQMCHKNDGHELKSNVLQQDQKGTTSHCSIKSQVTVKSLDFLSSDFIKTLQDKKNEHVNQSFTKATKEGHHNVLKEGASSLTSLDSLKDYLPKSKTFIFATNSSKIPLNEALNESLEIKHSFVLVQFTRKWLRKCGWTVGKMVEDLDHRPLHQNCKRILEWIEVTAVRYRDQGMRYFNLGIVDCRILRYYLYLQQNKKSCQTQEFNNEDIDKNELQNHLTNLLALYTFEEMPKDLIDLVAELKLGNSGVALEKDAKLDKILQCNESQMAQLNRDDGEESTDSGAGLSTIFSDDDNQQCQKPNFNYDKTNHKSTGTCLHYNDHHRTFVTEDIIMTIYKCLQDEMVKSKKTISLNIYNICSDCDIQKNQSIIIENVLDSSLKNDSTEVNMLDKKRVKSITKTARKNLNSDSRSISGITNHMKQTACHSKDLGSTTDENLKTSKFQTKEDKGIFQIRNANDSSRSIAPKDHKNEKTLERNIESCCINNTRPSVTTLPKKKEDKISTCKEKTSNLATNMPVPNVHKCGTESIIKSSTPKEIQTLLPTPKETQTLLPNTTTTNQRENDMSVSRKNIWTRALDNHSNFIGFKSRGSSNHAVSLQSSAKLVDTKDYCYAKLKTKKPSSFVNDNCQQVKDTKLCSNKLFSKDNHAAMSNCPKDGEHYPRKRRNDGVIATSSLKRSKPFLLPTPLTRKSETTEGKIKSSACTRMFGNSNDNREKTYQESIYKFREGCDHIKKTSSSGDYKHMNKARLHQESRLDSRPLSGYSSTERKNEDVSIQQ